MADRRFNQVPRRSARMTINPSMVTDALNRFQSTPPAEARGDRRAANREAGGACFNPLPPPKRGETDVFKLDDLIPEVSILCLLFIHPRAPNLIGLRSPGTMPA